MMRANSSSRPRLMVILARKVSIVTSILVRGYASSYNLLVRNSLNKSIRDARAAPSPARHGGCKKDSNRRAACPLPQAGEGSSERGCPSLQPAGEGSSERAGCPIPASKRARELIEALQIIVTVPVLLELLLCHSRAWLPREESRSFSTSSSGIRPRAPDTRAGMTGDRADVLCLYLVQDSIV